jgi:glycosyltransferase involved in cell wall biosynthesis
MPVSVAVNLLWCDPGRVGGSEQYLTRQLRGLIEIDPDSRRVEATIMASRRYAQAHPDLTAHLETRTPRWSMSARPVRIAAEHTWLWWRRGGADVVHHGGGTMPAGFTTGRAATVLTIHDLQYLSYPEYFSRARLAYLRSVVPRSARRATVITTPSEYVAATVVEAFGIDPSRIVVVPHGLAAAEVSDTAPTPGIASADERAAMLEQVRHRHGIGPGPFVIYPAITHPHKNHAVLIEAFADPRVGDLQLVFIGGRGTAEDEVGDRIVRHGLGHRVIRPGRVSDAERDVLIAGAEALVFPSRYEGFGAPIIEAMASGTAVIASDHPALVEVGGDAVVYLSPDEPGAWAEALGQVTARDHQRVHAGRERARLFEARFSASALIEAYERAVETGPVP